MRRLLLLPVVTGLLFACGDSTNVGGGGSGQGGQSTEVGGGGSGSGGKNPQGGGGATSDGGGGQGGVPTTGGNGGEGGVPTTGGNGGNGGNPNGGNGGNGGNPNGGNGGNGGNPNGGNGGNGGTAGGGGTMTQPEDCSDNVDNDGDNDIDCADTDCATAAVCGHIVINEVDYDQLSTDATEFVELLNTGSTTIDLSTVQLVFVNGSGSGSVYDTMDLTGTIAPGAYLVLKDSGLVLAPGIPSIDFPAGATGNVQNGAPDALALYDVASDTLLDAVSYEGTVPAGITFGTSTYDFFETVGTTAADVDQPAPLSIIRSPNGADTDDNQADWTTTGAPSPGAPNTVVEVCTDGVDNDGDNLVDCQDSDCSADPACPEICNNGVDDNANTFVDCEDQGCDTKSCGPNGLECDFALGTCRCPGGNLTEANCADGLDDDCDGAADCADTDCAAACTTLLVTSVDYPVIAQGGKLVISGSGFTGVTSVTIGGVSETFNVDSSTQITIASVLDTTPIGAGQQLIVTTGTGSSPPFLITPIRLQVSELDSNQPGTDTLEFVEISTGVPNVSLAGYSLVFYNGGGTMPANGAYVALDLAVTTNGSGLLLVGNAAVTPAPAIVFADSTLQNGEDGVGLYQAAASTFVTSGTGATVVTNTALIDALVYDTADPDDPELLDTLLFPAPDPRRVQLDEGSNAAGGLSETQSIARCGDGRRDGRKFVAVAPPSPGVVNTVICP